MKCKHAAPHEFLTPEFAQCWDNTMALLQSRLWVLSSWQPNMVLEMFVEASAQGFGAVLLGHKKILALYSASNPQAFHHSTVAELEGLVRSLHAFKHLLVNRAFTV